MYALHIHSCYSLADAVNTPEEIVKRCSELGIKHVTLTDHNTMMGTYPFMKAGKQYDINTIPGIEATFGDYMAHMILIPMNYEGYKKIIKTVRDAGNNQKTVKGYKTKIPVITKEMLISNLGDGADVIITSACISGLLGRVFQKRYSARKEEHKLKEKLNKHKEGYEKYQKTKELEENTKLKIKEYKEEIKRYSKFFSKSYENKLKKAQGTEQYNEYLVNQEDAKKAMDYINDLLSKEENKKKEYKTDILEYKKDYVAYNKLKTKEVVIPDSKELVKEAISIALFFAKNFKNFYIELQNHGLEEEKEIYGISAKIARKYNIPLIMSNDAHFITGDANTYRAREILCFNKFEKAEDMTEPMKELYITTPDEIKDCLLKILPESVVKEAYDNLSILEKCKVVIPEEKHYPKSSESKLFYQLLKNKRQEMIDNGTWTKTYEERLIREVDVISKMNYIDYHLIVRDFCNVGRTLGNVNNPEGLERYDEDTINCNQGDIKLLGIGPGRGSAAGSLVCFMLGITSVDPIQYGLLFERFLNPERVSMPDIDTDIATSIRPYLIKYLKEKYGDNAICSISTVNTYGAKGAIQMVGRERAKRLFGDDEDKKKDYYYNTILKLSDIIPETPNITLNDCINELRTEAKDDTERNTVIDEALLIEGKVSNLGIHAGGVVMSDIKDLGEYLPLLWNDKKNVWASQCDMFEIEENGLLKMDILGLTALDCINDTLRLIKKHRGEVIDVLNIPFEEEVFEEIYAKGNTNSIFQFESDGMKNMLRRFKPTCFEDIVLLNAAYRPGPMQYLDNIIDIKNGIKPITYKTPELESILNTTYGSVIYQEQVMMICQKLAGFSLGEADIVRRYMSKKKMEALKKSENDFVYGNKDKGIKGCVNNGISESVAKEIFNELTEFAKYAFNKSHACAYSKLSYITAYLKHHYPTEYLCSMFNNKKPEDYKPIITDCYMYGIKILRADINHSYKDFIIETDKKIRYGFLKIKNIGEADRDIINKIISQRQETVFTSLSDFIERVKPISNSFYKTLCLSGCLDSISKNRESLIKAYNGYTVSDIENDKYINKQFNHGNDMVYLNTVFDNNLYLLSNVYEINDENLNLNGMIVSTEKKSGKFGNYMYIEFYTEKGPQECYISEKNLKYNNINLNLNKFKIVTLKLIINKNDNYRLSSIEPYVSTNKYYTVMCESKEDFDKLKGLKLNDGNIKILYVQKINNKMTTASYSINEETLIKLQETGIKIIEG